MTDRNITEYLRERSHITTPEIQQYFDLTYSKARELRDSMIRRGIIEQHPDGISYKVNEKSVCPRRLTEQTCKNLVSVLSDQAIALLGKIHKDGCISFEDMEEFEDAELAKLLWKNSLLHSFDGRWFCSVDGESYSMLLSVRSNINVKNRDLVFSLAYPALKKAVKKRRLPNQLSYLKMVPKECREYLDRELKRYMKTSALPKPMDFKELDARELSIYLIESMMIEYDFESAEEYISEIKKQASIIKGLDISPEVLVEAAQLAADSVENKLTYTQMREIRYLALLDTDDSILGPASAVLSFMDHEDEDDGE